MKNYFVLLLLFISLSGFSQYKTVLYDYEKNWFNESQPLPAESDWTVNGFLPAGIKMVELLIYTSSVEKRDAIYSSDYREVKGKTSDNFSIPVNYRLHGGENYSFKINYYRQVSNEEILILRNDLAKALSSYIDQSIEATRNGVNLRKHPRLVLKDLNMMVDDGLNMYRNKTSSYFPGFSQLVYDKILQIEELSLKKARFNLLKGNDDDKDLKVKYLNKNLEDLKNLVRNELNQYLGFDYYILSETRIVNEYPSETIKKVLPINIGYAGIYNQGGLKDLSYGTSPYLGISLPLANNSISSSFWSKTSVSGGVMLNKLDFGDGSLVSGPIIDRPLYISLGYKTMYFLRFNAGLTILQTEAVSLASLDVNKILVRPFVGLSIEINLWAGFGN